MAGSKTVLKATCLNTSYSLRRQLLLSFGGSACLTLTIVVILASIMSRSAGAQVKGKSEDVLRDQIIKHLVESSQFEADDIGAYINALEGTVQLIVEATQERIVGYPNDGYEDDRHVPFPDTESERNAYPLKSPLLPLDWDINVNVNASNAVEHLQEKFELADYFQLSTASGSFHIQGTCDPAVTDPTDNKYYPNCTEANNDIDTGGVVFPTSTSKWLHEKVSDLSVLLKPLYETIPGTVLLGVYLSNSGAGAMLEYPGNVRSGAAEPYVSEGCDWMRETNPYTEEPFATEEEIARCHPAGTLVHQRDYNPLDRSWFKDFALHPDEVRLHGPFRAGGGGIPIITVGRAIFDRRTGHLIGCAVMDLLVTTVSAQLQEARLNEQSELALVRYDDGVVVADSIDSYLELEVDSILIADTGLVDEVSFNTLKSNLDFTGEWTREGLRQMLAENVVVDEAGNLLTGHPLPIPPKEYDPSYRPEFIVLHAISEAVFNPAEEIDVAIDDDVRRIILSSVGLGLLGMALVLAIVWCVSRMLTQPLLWMESVAWRIVNHTDKRAFDVFRESNEDELAATLTCTPKTEISMLVSEFRTMIQGFSGEGASKVAESSLYEIANAFTWQSDFQQLYAATVSDSRRSFKSNSVSTETTEETSEPSADVPRTRLRPIVSANDKAVGPSSSIVPAPPKKNKGRNLITLKGEGGSAANSQLEHKVGEERILTHRSSLFWWILALIVIPSLLTMTAICTVVSVHIFDIVPSWVGAAGDKSYQVEVEALQTVASLKAALMRTRMVEPVRDLHLYTRLAGWLLFGGVTRSDSFTVATAFSEECKTRLPDGSCSYLDPEFTDVCDCEWEDARAGTCTDYPGTDPRALQRRFFACQARDADNETGNRVSATSFPALDYSPETTLWWATTSALPGAWKGRNASGYETTYDRVRVASAMAIVDMPIYNYARKLDRPNQNIGTFVAFDADGMLTGFDGCGRLGSDLAFFASSDENRAAEIAPELCPIGKYGFDSRCRDWYATGKARSLDWGEAVHFTAPYLFAGSGGEVAASATSAIVNPITGEYAGQTLYDFFPAAVRSSLEGVDAPLSFVITPQGDVTGGDTLVGPNKTTGWFSSPIGDLVFLNEDARNRAIFERDILPDMKSGKAGTTYFTRLKKEGTEEKLTLVYEPVHIRTLESVSPADFSRGVSMSAKTIYSIGIAFVEKELRMPIEEQEDSVYADLEKIAIAYLCLVIFFSLLLIVFSYRIAIYVTRPMITLLHTIQNINNGKIEDDIPPLNGGSSEVHQVYNSFAKLFKTVRISNTAFFSGNLQWAYHFTSDALQLYRKVHDQKAIGIASNNLGNTLHAMHHQKLKGLKKSMEANGSWTTEAALKYFDEAVNIAHQEFDAESLEETKADFAQQLADRLFNRGLFHLLIKDDADAPENAKDRGYEDIGKARGLDYDVKDFWLERKLLLKKSASYFSRVLRRIHGLVDFHSDEALREVWNVTELIEDADQLLFAAWKEPSAPLFDDLSRVGRLQQLEATVVRYEFCNGNTAEAARMAMRMFAEDEYLLECSFTLCATALVEYHRGSDPAPWSSATAKSARADLRKMLKSCKHASLDIGKCFVFNFELSERWEGDPILAKINTNCLRLLNDYCSRDDFVGLVAQSAEGELTRELAPKGKDFEQQQAALNLASLSTSERYFPAFPTGVQMVVDAAASTDNDSFILLMTDGYSWDSEAYASTKEQIELLNSERNTTIHAIILGIDVEEDWIIEQCKMISTVSKKSLYMDVTLENIHEAFDTIAGLLGGHVLDSVCMQGVTMEKF